MPDRMGLFSASVIALDPKYVPVRIALIELETRDGKFNRAMKLANEIRETQKNSPVGDMLVGDVFMRQKKFDDAVKAHRASLALSLPAECEKIVHNDPASRRAGPA